MSGPLSLPMGSKTEYTRLKQFRCDVHNEKCGLDRDACVRVTWREWSLKRNKRIDTGKTN